MSRTIPWVIVAALIGAAACSRTIEEKIVVDERAQPCADFCASRFSTPCGPGGTESYATEQECREQCTTVGEAENSFDFVWGYDSKTGKDMCATEMVAYTTCLDDLSEDDFCFMNSGTINEVPPEDRPCFEEITAMSQCNQNREAGR